MRIAIITSYWNPPRFRGGISRVIFELRRIWIAQGHEVHIFASSTATNKFEGIFRLPSPHIPFLSIWNNAFLSLFKKLTFYDIVFPQSAIGCMFIDKKKCVPFTHTLFGVEHKVWWRPWRYTYGFLERLALKNVIKCIALSEDVITTLVSEYKLSRSAILKIYNGVDYNKFTPVKKPQYHPFIIFTAGRFIPRKRFDLLIKAFALFVNIHKDAKLFIAGDGYLEKNLKALVSKLNISDKVTFLGILDDEKMLEIYRSSTIFILPSIAEGMPLVVLEAQSCGLPVIIGDFDSSKEVIEEGRTGFIVRSSEAQDWVQKLCLLYEDEELRQSFAIEARKRIIKYFDWKIATKKIMGCFDEVLRKADGLS